ncbi:MAG: lysophospholipid acyltransferase [Kineosporiaceae bacterium]|nr:lysophospholipid acyltransferase [Kineosporiaceae bacterium]
MTAGRCGRRLCPMTNAAAPPGEVTDATALLDEPALAASLQRFATEHGSQLAAVRTEAHGYLTEMLASHGDRATRSWNRFGAWMLRAHDVLVDEEELARLRSLDREHSLALIFSHRSYLDGWVLPLALAARRFSPTYTFGGANLDLPVLGRLASRTGVIFIRRATRDTPVYRLALRGYIAHLVRQRANLAWSIEGGRTRTGKLRPPVHGILRYLVDAVESGTEDSNQVGSLATPPIPEVMVVPIAIVYDQLHEVARMTAEAKGGRKRPEDFGWLVSFARSQRQRLGRAYLTVGEPMPLRQRMAELRGQGLPTHTAVERVALDVSHRINRATPVTVTAVVCLALLGADRALTFDRVLDTVEPLATYLAARQRPVAGAATLTDRSTIRRTLQELTASGVLDCYDAGTEPVWRIAPDQHLVAAFYRNTVIHFLVERAIGEVALLSVGETEGTAGGPAGGLAGAWHTALALRDLLKFEFFFGSRTDFLADLRQELTLLTGVTASADTDLSPQAARELLAGSRPHLAPLVLRPFLDAYLLVADRLAALGDAELDDAAAQYLLTEALQVGEQWVLQRRVASAESVSLELFRTGLRLVEHRGLVRGQDLATRRTALRDEIAGVVAQLDRIADLDRAARRGDQATDQLLTGQEPGGDRAAH